MSRDIFQEITDKIITKLEQGTSPWVKPWEGGNGGSAPQNAITGKPYQGINHLILLSSQPNSDPRWATFNQAKEAGWNIKKGAHGEQIVRFVEVEKNKKEGEKTADGGKPEGKDDKKDTFLVPKTFTVFHASNIEGIPALQKVEKTKEEVSDAIKRVQEIPNALGVPLQHGGNRAAYSPTADFIRMPAIENFKSHEDYAGTLLHESSHATGHKDRLNRDLSGGFGSQNYAKEELRAEIASVFLSEALGVPISETSIGNHAAYLSSWVSVLKDDKFEIVRASKDAEKITGYVLEREKAHEKGEREPEKVREERVHAVAYGDRR